LQTLSLRGPPAISLILPLHRSPTGLGGQGNRVRIRGGLPQKDVTWGDALQVLEEMGPALRIINLETSVTLSEDYAPKGIHYRMHPGNTGVLVTAGIDACVLANNHVMDRGASGLLETLDTLRSAGIRTAGAGGELRRAQAPAVLEAEPDGRVLLFAFCTRDSGVSCGGLHPLGRELGLCRPEVTSELRPWPHRGGGRPSPPRPFLPSSHGDGGPPGTPHPIWMRGFPERLRGDSGPSAIPGRPGPHVSPHAGWRLRCVRLGSGVEDRGVGFRLSW